MKILFLFVSLMFWPLSPMSKMNSVERAILNIAHQLCGDTWCAGDYNFNFHRVFCYRGSRSPVVCEFEFDMTSYNYQSPRNDRYNAIVRQRTPVFCEIFISHPWPGKGGDIRTYYDGHIHEKLTDCIWELEQKLR